MLISLQSLHLIRLGTGILKFGSVFLTTQKIIAIIRHFHSIRIEKTKNVHIEKKHERKTRRNENCLAISQEF